MQSILIIISIVVSIFSIVGIILIVKRLKNFKEDTSDDKSSLLLQQQIQELTRTLDQKLADSSKAMQDHTMASAKMVQEQFIESSKVARDTVAQLTQLQETNKQVLNFSDQLKNLQDILKNPKQRGVLGEYYLEETLRNVLPPNSYEMQYKLGRDEKTNQDLIVDAVVKVKGKLIPVDSKFSLENYERILAERDDSKKELLERNFKQDLKNRIDETAKYVRPDFNTMDFAFMFIPSEAIYYDLLVNKVGAVAVNTRDLIEYAFLAYLQTVLQGLRAMQIEESAKEIKGNVEKLEKHLGVYNQYMQKLGSQLGTVVNTYNTASTEFKKIDKDVLKITETDRELLEAGVVEKPKE
jgi:DNA recombination protein RmuC